MRSYLFVFILSLSCIGLVSSACNEGGNIGGMVWVGGSCSKTSDCMLDLECVEGICVPPGWTGDVDVSERTGDVDITECVPDCSGAECGDDGCGGDCGTCPDAAPLCVDRLCVPDCDPVCVFEDGSPMECGDDGCGGPCGECPLAAPFCVEHLCMADCTPDCVLEDGSPKECGDDGCDGSCGECGDGLACADGECVSAPECGALALDGTSGWVQVDHSPELDFDYDEDFSLALWVRLPATQVDTAAESNRIIEKWDSTVMTPYPYALRVFNQSDVNNGRIKGMRFTQNYQDHPGVMSTVMVNDDTWHHVVFQRNQGQLELWIDGVLDNATQDTTSETTANNQIVRIGGWGEGCPHCPYLSGTIDEVSIWSRALAEPEIQGMTDGTLEYLGQADLSAYWSFDEGVGGSSADLSGNGNTATLMGGANWIVASGLPSCCVPDCVGKDCGEDGCDGSCGECEDGWDCVEGLCEETCVPDCLDKDCGEDGCGGSCGDCAVYESCSDGVCVGPDSCNTLHFDGIDDWVEVPHSPELNPGTGSFTVEAWVRTDLPQSHDYLGILAMKRAAGLNNYYAMTYVPLSDGIHLGIRLVMPNFHFVNTAVVAPLGTWNHIAYQRSGSDLSIFLNGDPLPLEGTWHPSAEDPGAISIENSGSLWISQNAVEDPGEEFRGRISELRITNTAVYSGVFEPQPYLEPLPDTVLLYHFADSSGETILDSSGNDNDGTVIGATWIDDPSEPICCIPDCLDKECGGDGCGGSCGDCLGATQCTEGGCVPSCDPPCSEDAICIDLVCYDAENCWGEPEATDSDEDGLCDDSDLCIGDNSFGDADGDGVCGDRPYCGEQYCCAVLESHPWCVQDGCDKEIADDINPGKCGGGCCYACYFDCVEIPEGPCEPDCDGKECGEDSCGGSCGDCADGDACTEGSCVAPVSCGVLSFDGINDRVEVPNSPELSPGTGDFTVEVWAKSDAPVDFEVIGALARKQGGSGGGYKLLYAPLSNGIHLIFMLSQGGGNLHYAETWAPLQRWNHIAFQRAGGIASIFINGVSAPLFSWYHPSVPPPNTMNIQNSGPLEISRNADEAPLEVFSGALAEFRVTNAAVYSEDFEPQPHLEALPDTVLLYHFADSSGDVVLDSSGNGNDGTVMGATWIEDPSEPVCCIPDCLDKDCGADGCGGSCGECVGATECAEGACVPSCDPPCSEDAICIDLSCYDGENCWGEPETTDADGDGLCDDSDLCIDDNSFGDADGDGVCGDRPYCGEQFCCAIMEAHPWCTQGGCDKQIADDIMPGLCVGGCCYYCFFDCVEIPEGQSYSIRFPISAGVTIPDHPDLQFETGFSFSTWVKPFDDGDARCIISKPRMIDGTGLRLDASHDHIRVTAYLEPSGCELNGPGVPVDEWAHVGATWDGSLIRLYLNGALVGMESCTGTPSWLDENRPLRIGLEWENAEPMRSFYGDIFEVKAWTTALSEQEMLDAYSGMVPGTPAGVWLLDEGSGTTASDSSGGNHHGTLDPSLTWVTTGP